MEHVVGLIGCGFRRKPPTYSNLMLPTVPT
jgi:hypothetical protein